MQPKQPKWTLKEITPALDFLDGVAYVTVPVRQLEDNKVKTRMELVTSSREKFSLMSSELAERKLYTDRHPSPMARWSEESIDEFLSGEREGDLDKAIEYVREQYAHYVDLGDDRWSLVLAVWVVATYFHRFYGSFPYIHLNGNMRSGKTKTLTLTSLLAFNGELISNSSSSFVVRIVHDNHSTCCIDEAENLRRPRDENSQTVISVFNQGYKKGAFVGKSEQVGSSGKWVPKRFDAYCPKMFASIKDLELSLASRCIPITMIRSSNRIVSNREVQLTDPVFQGIRDELYLAMMSSQKLVQAIYDSIQDETIEGREWELWRPLFAVARIADPTENLYHTLRKFALEIIKQKEATTLESDVAPLILDGVSSLIEEGSDDVQFIALADLVSHLIDFDPDAFAWLQNHNQSSRWVGDQLRRVGIVSGKAIARRVDGTPVKGFELGRELVEERRKVYR